MERISNFKHGCAVSCAGVCAGLYCGPVSRGRSIEQGFVQGSFGEFGLFVEFVEAAPCQVHDEAAGGIGWRDGVEERSSCSGAGCFEVGDSASDLVAGAGFDLSEPPTKPRRFTDLFPRNPEQTVEPPKSASQETPARSWRLRASILSAVG